jgi:hypothetical protein
VGVGMSVCIAAVSRRREGKCIVLALDLKASLKGGVTSADIMPKGRSLVRQRWFVLFAGEDVERIDPLIRRMRAKLDGNDWPNIDEVMTAAVRSHAEEKREQAAELHLSIYGLDTLTFLSNGARFDRDTFAQLRERLDQCKLDIALLIAGFDPDGHPRIGCVTNQGVRGEFDTNIGYWAVGSGDYAAVSRLALRNQKRDTYVTQTIYNVIEAKVAAQRSEGVGERTSVLVLAPDEPPLTISNSAGQAAVSAAETNLAPPVTPALLTVISDGLIVSQEAPQVPTLPKDDQSGQPPSQE